MDSEIKIDFFLLGWHIRAQSSIRSQYISRYHIESSNGIRRRPENRILLIQSGYMRNDSSQAE